jgi:hypothetical protein
MGLGQRRFKATAMIQSYPDKIFLTGHKARQGKQHGHDEIVINLSIVLAYFPKGKTTEGV